MPCEDNAIILLQLRRRVRGVVSIVAEWRYFGMVVREKGTIPDDDAAEGSSSHVQGHTQSEGQQDTRSSGPARGKLTEAQKKAQTGMNKGRRFGKVAAGGMCDFRDQCRNNQCPKLHSLPLQTNAQARDANHGNTAEAATSVPLQTATATTLIWRPIHALLLAKRIGLLETSIPWGYIPV
ncbi:hypothetical protein DFH09DRAFT_1269202 [Mycena vulgaris]|nr:hypothetical protein DFH09DRAFT_1269202 [Mycena vulgaris]